MANKQLSLVTRYLQDLREIQGHETPDALLLERFALRHEEAAFAVLLRRHGPMVLSVSRRVLRSPEDAEDVFQATFLLLARKAASIRKPGSVGSWLHGVAQRLALKARRQECRRQVREKRAAGMRETPSHTEAAWQEVQATLDLALQELPERYRSVLVLCCLEGRSHAEAAQQLGCPVATVCTRIHRGRKLLRDRLAKRGFTLSMAGLTSLLLAHTASASLPYVLVKATSKAAVAFAKGQTAAALCSAQTARLIQSGLRTLFLTKMKTATALLLAVDLLAGVALMTHRVLGANGMNQPPAAAVQGQTDQVLAMSQPERAKENAHRIVEVAGRVLDPEGRPFPGAKLYLRYRYDGTEEVDYPVRATSDADGRFFFTFARSLLKGSSPDSLWFHVLAVGEGYGPDWAFHNKPETRAELLLHLVPDFPIQGRILDLDGKPVKDAKLRIESTAAYSDTEAFLQSVRAPEWPTVYPHSKRWPGPFPGQPRTLTTDADGRFRLAGVGKDRLVQFQLQGSNIEWRLVRVLARDMKAPVEPRKQQRYGPAHQTVYPATFQYFSQPSRLIRGVVRDKNTGRPVAGVRVNGDGTTDLATTDAGGRFELRGIGKSERGYRLSILPTGQQYFSRGLDIPDTPGLEPIDAAIELVSGIVVKGRVTHQETGKPVAGARVEYNPLFPNSFVARLIGPAGPGIVPCSWTETGPDGSYALVVLPGPGALGFRAQAPKEIFMPALVTRENLKQLFKDNQDHGDEDLLYTQASPENASSRMAQSQFNHLLLINPGEKEETFTRDIALQPAKPLRGKVLGPDGQPFAGAIAYNLEPGVVYQHLRDDTFTVKGLNPRRTRKLFFVDKERKLGAFLALKGEVKEPLTVRLEPCGCVNGRVLDADGEPVAGAFVRLDPYDSSPAKVKTDSQGRFRIEGIVAGQRHQARFGPEPFLGQYLYKPFAIKPGESKDLGEVRLKRQP